MDSTTQSASNTPDTDTPATGEDMLALIGELREAAKADGLNGRQLADKVGIPQGTWSSFMGGTYAGRKERLVEAGRAWLDGRKTGKRIHAVLPKAPCFVSTPTARSITAVLEHCQHAPDLGLIAGPAGVGKTSSITAYRRRSANVWVVTAEPSLRTPRQLLDYIAEELQLLGVRGTQGVSRAVMRRVKDTGGLLILDEAQHLTTEALDQLRTIHDLAGIGVALVGNETVHQRIEGAGRSPAFAQLFSRVGMRLPGLRTRKADVDMLLDAWAIEGDAERRVVHAIARTPGALRVMTKVLQQAHLRSSVEGGTTVTAAQIQDAYQTLSATTLPEKGVARA